MIGINNEAKITKQRLEWVDIAKGIAIILMIVGHEIGNKSIIALIFSFHMPLFFILSGYTSRPVTTWQKWRRKFKQTFMKVWLLAVIMVLLLGIEYWAFSPHKNISQSLANSLIGIFWGSNIPARGINDVGVMWFMFVFFWAKLLFDFLQVLFPNRYNGVLLGVLAYLMSVISQSPFHWFPQAMDIVPIAALFMWCGQFIKWITSQTISNGELQVNRIEQLAIATAFIYWTACIQNNIYIELAVRHYPYFIFSFIEAIAGTLVFSYISKCFCLNRYFAFLKYAGRHTLALLCIHHLDLYWVTWGGVISSGWLAAIVRLVLDLGILIIFLWIVKLVFKYKKRRL